MQWFGYVVVFLKQYLVPSVFAIGMIFLIYGVIQYFIIGPGEEPTREEGREHFIKAFVWFLGGVLLYAFVALLVWFISFMAGLAVEGDRHERIQNVPNIPTRNN